MSDPEPPCCPYCGKPLEYVLVQDYSSEEPGGIICSAPVCKNPNCPNNEEG